MPAPLARHAEEQVVAADRDHADDDAREAGGAPAAEPVLLDQDGQQRHEERQAPGQQRPGVGSGRELHAGGADEGKRQAGAGDHQRHLSGADALDGESPRESRTGRRMRAGIANGGRRCRWGTGSWSHRIA